MKCLLGSSHDDPNQRVTGSENSSSDASTTMVDLVNLVDGENIETTENTTPSATIHAKEESLDAVVNKNKSSSTGYENSSSEDLTTVANLRDSGEGEYIETTENTPSSISNSPIKEVNSEMKGLTDAHQDKVKENDRTHTCEVKT